MQEQPTPGVTQSVTYIINTWNPALRASQGILTASSLLRTFICFVHESVSYQISLSNHRRFHPLSSCYQIILTRAQSPDYLKSLFRKSWRPPGRVGLKTGHTWSGPCPPPPGSEPPTVRFLICKLQLRVTSLSIYEMAKLMRTHDCGSFLIFSAKIAF